MSRRLLPALLILLTAIGGSTIPARAEQQAMSPAADAPAAGATGAIAGGPGGSEARGEASRPRLDLGGWLQADWVVSRQASLDEVDPSTGAPLNDERFLIRRARARLDGAYAATLGRIELDLNSVRGLEVRPFEVSVAVGWSESGQVQRLGVGTPEDLARAEISRPPAVLASVGLLRVPFGFDAVESPTRRPMLERTRVVRALFPGQRDFGLGVDAEYRELRLSVALMNGAPIGDAGGQAFDYTGRVDLVGRLGVDVGLGSAVRLAAGLSGMTGQGLHLGTAATKDELSWQDGNEDGLVAISELGVIPGSPATPSQTFSRFALGADARVTVAVPVVGALMLRAELIRAQNLDRALEPADPIASGRDLRELGWALGVAQELTRYAQVALQYESYDPDADAREQRAASIVPRDARYTTLSVAAAARFDRLRLMAQFDHESNALGRDAGGAPTTLANDGLTLRAELVF